MPEDTKPEGTAPKSDDSAAQVEFHKAEAAKAFKARDEVKKQLRDLETRVMSDDDRALFDKLKSEAEKGEEARKRKEGEFDAWRSDIVKKHDEALKAAHARAEQADARYRQKLIGLEFAGASSLFGDAGKTVLTPEVAESYLGKFVEVQTDEQGTERGVVKGLDGHAVLDVKTGKPASFADAIFEVIQALPTKDRLLRGSGKTGSGSSGGTTSGTQGVDLGKLTARDFRDPKIREAVRQRQNSAGALQIGPAFDRALSQK